MLKINFAMWGMRRSGGARVLFEVANRLVAKGHDVTFTSLGSNQAHLWFPLRTKVKYIEKTAPIVHQTYPHLLDSAFRRSTRWRVDRIRNLSLAIPDCDVNVATYCLTAFAVNRSGKGKPFYYVQHYEPFFFDDPYTRQMVEETYSLPMQLVTVSSWLRKTIREKYSKDAQVILNGVDRRIFFPRDIRNNGKTKRIMCIGRSIEWKGMNDMIQAMNIVHKGHPSTELVIVTQDRARRLGMADTGFPYRIVRAPNDEDLAREYSASDVFVSPSWYEGFSLTVLEAMSCGARVVTTSPGTEDYAINERNSLVVNPRKPDEIATAITRILTDETLSSTLRAEGIRTAEKLTWEKTATSFEDAVTRT